MTPDAVLAAIVSGFVSCVATVISLKTDLHWIKCMLNDHEDRLRKLEEKQ